MLVYGAIFLVIVIYQSIATGSTTCMSVDACYSNHQPARSLLNFHTLQHKPQNTRKLNSRI